MRPAHPKNAIDSILAKMGQSVSMNRQIILEWSLKITKQTLSQDDRLTCWFVEDGEPKDFSPILNFLRQDGAPEEVIKRHIELANKSLRQGISISVKGNTFERRLYIHHIGSPHQSPRYEALLWGVGKEVRTASYEFHFLPESAAGDSPLTVAHPKFKVFISEILKMERVRQMSGFWLRKSEGVIDQLDIIFPWQPELKEMTEALLGICQEAGAPTSWIETYGLHPLRHLAFNVNPSESPSFTAYFSGPADATWPSSLQQLKETVQKNGNLERSEIDENILQKLPKISSSYDTSLDEFYSTEHVDLWKEVLGQGMHYHAGIYSSRITNGQSCDQMSDEIADRAARRAVQELYPFISRGARIYDIGCGWSGPLKMLTEDLDCQGVGITISKTQFLYGRQLGLEVRHGDAETTLPPGHFDCMILIESFCHVKEKLRLLKVMRLYSKRLVMRVNCQDWRENSVNFGGTMHMIKSRQLREMLVEAGWTITHWRDRRMEALPSVSVWGQRLQAIPPNEDRHMNVLREYTNAVLKNPLPWAVRNPLIEVVAD